VQSLRSGVAGSGFVRRAVSRAFLLVSASLLVTLPASPAAAASRGTIEGRVINATTGKTQRDVVVTLSGGARGAVIARTRTDAAGHYRFTGLRTGDDRPYALDAHYHGGLFAGRAVTLPGDTARAPVITGTLRVWETASDPRAIVVRRDDLFLIPNEGALGVLQSVTLANTSDRAYIGRGGKGAPSVAFSLPAGADIATTRILRATLDIPRLVPLEDLGGFGTTVAIPPGEIQITFSYRVEGSAGNFDLSRRALYPTIESSIHARDPITVSSDRLTPSGEVNLRGTSYRRWSLDGPLDAGAPLQATAAAEAGSTPLVVGSAVLLVVAGIAGALVVIRSRRLRARAAGSEQPSQPLDHDALVEAIAELDLRHDEGEVSSKEWSERRARLKQELTRARN
jgi:hypothetical protein